jgi:pyridoxal phosphate enzyme (YggS family)
MNSLSSRNIIASNLIEIKERITVAALKSGRNFSDISLVAVTKTVGFEEIKILQELDVHTFGENKVQILAEKMEHFSDESNNIDWHMIGNLQKNKVKYIIGKVKLIHSVGSIELLKEIDKRANNLGIVQDVLLEVNIAGELTKQGFEIRVVSDVAGNAANLINVKVRGLMCMAPFVEDKEDTRKYFYEMRLLNEKIKEKMFTNYSGEYLSMGMTNDFEIAIEEGANIIRVGTAIFKGLK